MNDPIVMLERALSATGNVLRNVRPDQYGMPTPCTDWTVRDLINHVLAGHRFMATFLETGEWDMSVWAADLIGDADPVTVYDESGKLALDAWRSQGPAALERRAALPSGAPGPKLIDMHLTDVFVHGWDLAAATGQDRVLDPLVAQALHDTWHGKVSPEARRPGVFEPEAECAPDAPVSDRLAAYLGRRLMA